MNLNIIKPLFFMCGMLFFLHACSPPIKKSYSTEETFPALSSEDKQLVEKATAIFGILGSKAENPENPLNADKIALGKMLYFERRLSRSGSISCNSCHDIATYGVDNLPTSLGYKWQNGDRNSPTTLNAAFHFKQFWDGRANNVEEQAKGPMLNSVEMATPHADFAVERIASIEAYQKLFAKAFPNEKEALTFNNIANAIGAFERTLIVPSRFDDFLNGNGNALNTEEKQGLITFMNVGCNSCHLGPTFGGTMYQKFGVNKAYWLLTGAKKIDEGRMVVTKNKADEYFFKVPSLRNIEHTYPYFHDGSIWDLGQSVSIMGETQLGKTLTPKEVREIVVFLKALTGEIPEEALKLPVLPVSSNKTSRPEF